MKLSPYITELLREKSGNEIRLSRDCEMLALDVESVTGGDALRLIDENCSNSAFDDRDEYLACYLEKDQQVVISYPPNRSVIIENMGDNHFRVIESENSKLLKGDLLTLTHIVRHYPLLVSEVIRDGRSLGAFTAGKAQGIDFELL